MITRKSGRTPITFLTMLGRSRGDFAETFMVFLRNGGALPVRFYSRVLRRKWRFIADLSRVVASGGTRLRAFVKMRKQEL